ncbi:CheR family methyltransferase [Lysobacter terrae]
MQVDGFERWLKDTMGLDVTTIGPLVVQRAVRERMQACGCNDLAAYWQLLRSRTVEQQELIEAVVVPETWFFRDREAFAALARTFDLAWLAARADATLRLLSLPCSTGEEPYTMIMALRDAGYPIERLSVDAVDISERALAKARRGIYGANSFRGQDLHYRERHFRATADGWELSAEVRARASFRSGNMLEPGFLPGESLYDAIFCRNLLIYFDQATQTRAVGVLSRLLRPEGLLFVGPSETGLMLSLGFSSAQIPMAFAFQKGKPAAASVSMPPPTKAQVSQRPVHAPVAVKPARPTPRVAPSRPVTATPAVAPSLTAAQALADAGQFDEAARLCEAHARQCGPSAQTHYLLGLIDSAAGRPQFAEVHFRKALYLQPDHAEALVHLAVLLEHRGDAAGGRLLRQRARRHHSREAP